MNSRLTAPDEYELVERESFESDEVFDLDSHDFQSSGRSASSYASRVPLMGRAQALLSVLLPRWLLKQKGYQKLPARRSSLSQQRRMIIAFLVILTCVFNPSYTRPPKRYQDLRARVEGSKDDGRANPGNQKIFIAASIYDEGGTYLVGIGVKRIYENESGEDALSAQKTFENEVQCRKSIVWDRNFTMQDVPHVSLPDGSKRIKRIAFLAEVRNRALLPLAKEMSSVQYDKILYLNDVLFRPVDAAQLLFSTNHDKTGQASYRAACAVDFVNPFKFYDTFATRDADGYSMGVPFFPWFTSSGSGISRSDVLAGKDAVRVKSCWGGMVAFDARPFQASQPLQFRASDDLYWDASECCLIHADLMRQTGIVQGGNVVGIYMNPFVRVAYSARTLSWLYFTRRFERLYTLPHSLVNRLVGLPWFNPRRTEEAGKKVEEKIWVPNSDDKKGGSFQVQERRATGDGFCGRRGLQLIKESPREDEKNWEIMPVPPD
ncbi:uncharacterized protein KY384_003201 [Bacidia gigantensis]|uniref:uncharacterized protein n=1 Tax=Bacidia gigantensis TaxID=2732470 RepID=UPI001D04E12A|nr:uncharacterized protein KY384_003201 [Bacidia gigantensis]KAG8531571.1 hypothetical protein KY384_003201 [Bacidia gigantensis]